MEWKRAIKYHCNVCGHTGIVKEALKVSRTGKPNCMKCGSPDVKKGIDHDREG